MKLKFLCLFMCVYVCVRAYVCVCVCVTLIYVGATHSSRNGDFSHGQRRFSLAELGGGGGGAFLTLIYVFATCFSSNQSDWLHAEIKLCVVVKLVCGGAFVFGGVCVCVYVCTCVHACVYTMFVCVCVCVRMCVHVSSMNQPSTALNKAALILSAELRCCYRTPRTLRWKTTHQWKRQPAHPPNCEQSSA